MEVAALIFLLVGGLILPFVGWLVGVILLWLSNAWNVRDKIIGTVLVPGGLGFSLFVLFFYLASSSLTGGSSSCQIDPATGREFNCTESASSTSVVNALAIVLLVAIVVTPIITTAYLAYRLRRQPAAATV